MPVVEIAQHWIDELAELQQEADAAKIDDVVDAAIKQYMKQTMGVPDAAIPSDPTALVNSVIGFAQ